MSWHIYLNMDCLGWLKLYSDFAGGRRSLSATPDTRKSSVSTQAVIAHTHNMYHILTAQSSDTERETHRKSSTDKEHETSHSDNRHVRIKQTGSLLQGYFIFDSWFIGAWPSAQGNQNYQHYQAHYSCSNTQQRRGSCTLIGWPVMWLMASPCIISTSS